MEEEIHVEQPRGYVKFIKNNDGAAGHLFKALYGSQAHPSQMEGNVDKWLVSNGFIVSTADPYLAVSKYGFDKLQ